MAKSARKQGFIRQVAQIQKRVNDKKRSGDKKGKK